MVYGTLGAPADGIANAASLLTQAKADYTSGSSEADDLLAVTDYKVAASGAATSASASVNAIAGLLVGNARVAGYSAAAQNELDSANASVSEAAASSDRSTVEQAAAAGIAAAESALSYAKFAQTLPTSGGTQTGIVSWSSNTINAASMLASYLGSSGCDCSQQLMDLTKAFQAAYNADASLHHASTMTADGKYGTGTQKLLAMVLGGSAPSPCWGAGNPCFGKQPGGAPKPVPPPVTATPQPTGVIPVANRPTTGATNWLPWVLGATALATGGGLIWYMNQKKRPALARR